MGSEETAQESLDLANTVNTELVSQQTVITNIEPNVSSIFT